MSSVFTDDWRDHGDGRKAPPGSLAPGGILARLRHYKRTVARRYRIVPPNLVADYLPDGNLHVSTKVDGELWFVVKLSGEVALCAPNGRVVQGLPVADEAEELLKDAGDLIIAGELFAVAREGRPRVHHVARALGEASLSSSLGFKAFDLVAEGDDDPQQRPYEERYSRLQELLDGGRRLALVTTLEGAADTALECWEKWVESGRFEGLVVRTEQGLTYKVKPTLHVDAVVLGFGERRTASQREIRELIVGLLRDDGAFQVLGTVAGGLSETDKVTWFRRLDPMVVASSFRMANSEGTLCRFVRPEVVVQIRCSDLIDSDSRDAPIRRMTIAYDADGGWTPLGIMPIVSLIHPVLEGERPDKPVEPAHVGLEQVYAYLPFAGRDRRPEEPELTRSEVLDRRVWTKEARGATVVRKYVVIGTNKADESPDYPPFVVHFTDWSATRREPLQTTIRVASTREKLDVHVQAWVDKNIKRGWQEVDPA
jgi:hypothetical protein